ncbi:MAG: hypothetical protein A3J54_01780 [Candidatus Ryanbacteria bacterium RIFCSPHIGHO2_02_FULL_45_13b]|uniref:Uncharacterized protein n=1 Tax=Candidatus Ryanbacteria bacterium RIFCSPHIGHO2_02_FULL_45_13b TaxID=1802117 RepID=A0A1G2GA57_9BACT|nr:MAG: hypothetical protein A3J54_01780 [Candidatus Ryanbacteria bacterium RIFCSPHIGHO2_02_FULL_45_13b]
MGIESSFNKPLASNMEQEKKEDVLKVGDRIGVLRSSGDKEDDWTLSGFDEKSGEALVTKKEGEQTLTKKIRQIELYAINKPEGETRKFSAQEWLDLWNSTEVSHLRVGVNSVEKQMMWTPEEARKVLREKASKNAGGAQLRQGSKEEIILKLKNRIAFFGETDSESKELQFYEIPPEELKRKFGY